MLALTRPDLVRRATLVGIGPRDGDGMQTFSEEAQAVFTKERSVPDELWLDVFFTQSEASQAAGRALLERYRSRTSDRAAPINDRVAQAQLTAIGEWSQPMGERFAYLKDIRQPVLVVNGRNDIIVPTINSYHLQQHLPNARLILYPDSSHGSQYQYPDLFVDHATLFLAACSQRRCASRRRSPRHCRKRPIARQTDQKIRYQSPILIAPNLSRRIVTVGGRAIANAMKALTLWEASYPQVHLCGQVRVGDVADVNAAPALLERAVRASHVLAGKDYDADGMQRTIGGVGAAPPVPAYRFGLLYLPTVALWSCRQRRERKDWAQSRRSRSC